MGRCHECGEYGTLTEELVGRSNFAAPQTDPQISRVLPLDSIDTLAYSRLQTGLEEFDRVLGGGLVPGCVALLGGEPGIGKSTLLLQVLGRLSEQDMPTLYLSGEESPEQIGLRAERLGITSGNMFVAAETDLSAIEAALRHCHPKVAVIDSIQTVHHPDLDSAAGTLSQVRESTAAFVRLAKDSGTAVLLVGHVNKEGALAGPKSVEHIVDTVLTFEGDPHHVFRILRATKNRFGSTKEAGIFEMRSTGLAPVENPSRLFLAERYSEASGSCVTACMEGTRPVLGEVQALVTPSYFGTPRRMTTGADYNRCSVILAVMEKRLGMHLGNQDVHVNVVGGLKLSEPAVDLALAIACASSFRDRPTDEATVIFGEIGLAGEVRGVPHAARRVEEAERLGFKQCLLPRSNLSAARENQPGISLLGVNTLQEAIDSLLSG